MSEFEAWVAAINGKIGVGLVPALLLTGIFLTLRLGFVQLRRLWHGVLVTTGQLEKDEEHGDVSHFQALATALSATVGVGNIAGVAMAIHAAGPGALFWMWVTGFLGMAIKFTECTLAVEYRKIDPDPEALDRVAGGPMYYMTAGLGWKKLASFFALAMLASSLVSGSAIQANSMADSLRSAFGVAPALSGGVAAVFLAVVVLGGVQRIGQITSVLAPAMGLLYAGGALLVLALNPGRLLPAIQAILAGAVSPEAGVTGVGTGSLLIAATWGVRRGLYSSDAGAGSAPIIHAAARTEEPVSEGCVALLEPFIDTLLVCTLTGLVIVTTGAWDTRFPSAIDPGSLRSEAQVLEVQGGEVPARRVRFRGAWVEELFEDAARERPFTGRLERLPAGGFRAVAGRGEPVAVLHGDAVLRGAPLTARAFRLGLRSLGDWGHVLVALCVSLFAVSTALGVSYYGDRCAAFLFGRAAVLPFRLVYCALFFGGAITSVTLVWRLVDLCFSMATLPNLASLVLLSGAVRRLTDSYFERRPWEDSAEAAAQPSGQSSTPSPGPGAG